MEFRKVGLVGTGLIGGSIGLAIKKFKPQVDVIGFDKCEEVSAIAKKIGAIDFIAKDFSSFSEVELVFVSTPISAIVDCVCQVASYLKEGAIITDTGSVKAPIVEKIEKKLPAGKIFIGGHPMAGSDREGINFASSSLVENSYYILTPLTSTPDQAYLALHDFLTSLKAFVVAVDPYRHDLIVAYISHLPHLLAAAIVNLAVSRSKEEEGLLFFASSGFRDVTRIAGGNSQLWADILLENREAVLKALSELNVEIKSLKKALEHGNNHEVEQLLEKARLARRSLPVAAKGTIEDLRTLSVPVENKPGVLSEVTVLLGRAGINIEDIEIVHGIDRGVLKLTVSSQERAEKAKEILKDKGYEVSISAYNNGV